MMFTFSIAIGAKKIEKDDCQEHFLGKFFLYDKNCVFYLFSNIEQFLFIKQRA